MPNKAISGFFLFLLLTLKVFQSGAQVILTKYTSDLSVTGLNSEVYEDSSGKMSFEEVGKKTFQRQGKADLKNEHPKSVYWVRFKIHNSSGIESKWILETLTPNLYSLEAWIPDVDGRMKAHITGLNKNPFKEYPHKNYIFDLPSEIEDYEVYIRAWSPNVTGLEFKIRSQKYFTWYALNEYYFLGIYYGILLIMLVYNFLVFITNKEKVYFFYSLYLASCMFLSLSEDGLGMELLWKDYSSLNLYFYYYLAPSLFLISFVLYARSFLNLNKNFPLADKAAFISALIFPAINLFQAFNRDNKLFQLEDYYIVPFVIIFAASVFIYLKGYKSARFFILGYVIVFLSMIVLQLRLHRIIEANIFTVYIFNFGILVETVVLSFALADRLRIIRREKGQSDKELLFQLNKNSRLQERLVIELQEKNELSEKVNLELEQKVQQRTTDLMLKGQELTEANEKLDLYAKKLTDMNVQLDLDNWQLKKEVKKERTARIVQEELSYEEFIKSFSDKNACLSYLEEMKWAEAYSCRKCGNRKFTAKVFSRKCTRCDYLESPTSHTLFHGIKIPLNKAFFMIYSANNKGKQPTLEEMSELLNIGKNTCWDFRKKIKARLAEKKKVTEVDSWDVLILD
jgi:hypothetical protein